jgi:hypothetical protein
MIAIIKEQSPFIKLNLAAGVGIEIEKPFHITCSGP